MGTPVIGHSVLFGASASGAVDEQYACLSSSVGMTMEHLESEGTDGTRSKRIENLTEGTSPVGGTVLFHPRPDDLDNWLPRVFGGSGVLAETVPEFEWSEDKISKVFVWSDMKVNQAVFRSAQNAKMEMELDMQGKSEAVNNAGTFPSIAASLSVLQPYTHSQLVLTLGGTAYEVNNLVVTLNNALLLDRFNNSQTRTELPEGDRIVTVTGDFPYSTDETSLYDVAVTGLTGTNTAVWTNGARSLTFTFGVLTAPARPIPMTGKQGELLQRLEMTAYQTGATKEIAYTNDSIG